MPVSQSCSTSRDVVDLLPIWLRTFARAARPVTYLSVVTSGYVRAGDAVTIVGGPSRWDDHRRPRRLGAVVRKIPAAGAAGAGWRWGPVAAQPRIRPARRPPTRGQVPTSRACESGDRAFLIGPAIIGELVARIGIGHAMRLSLLLSLVLVALSPALSRGESAGGALMPH